jgi:glycine cleavage system pyridoxal-binding protein P
MGKIIKFNTSKSNSNICANQCPIALRDKALVSAIQTSILKTISVYFKAKSSFKASQIVLSSIPSLVRGFWDEKFSTRKSRTTEEPCRRDERGQQ